MVSTSLWDDEDSVSTEGQGTTQWHSGNFLCAGWTELMVKGTTDTQTHLSQMQEQEGCDSYTPCQKAAPGHPGLPHPSVSSWALLAGDGMNQRGVLRPGSPSPSALGRPFAHPASCHHTRPGLLCSKNIYSAAALLRSAVAHNPTKTPLMELWRGRAGLAMPFP